MSSHSEDTPGLGHNNPPPSSPPLRELPEDFDVRMMKALCLRLLNKLEDPDSDISVEEMKLARQVLTDNAITFAMVKRGDFGDTARRAAEEFPHND